ncbi:MULTISPECIES: carbohydrate ABC transporter permease [unclassified Chelatococcus]|uniref:carbohydrate ABC transporter permease n=1 Tax=unclassified Chelatococcus TaxID=2638111 RepID=UPI001BCFEF17|nr:MULTISPECIES: carbohydrate ABC transporter permease [unclassified Chelatococcus]CAH1656626.1 Carbohydrate ABC transporter membrane protein 2 (CUT1 family) [Hyphomicrobiales bacterium]MBS7742427.1 carbohydrate ABC transporter permease [Chelatococcus sp. HY11]MBX3542455.1 carbohydrate ABC transporter permease [Chelatococcus sp.]MCO5075328.1 carbohydrate ABC transporter permease [Chelatococcus sp.]CAH1695882.1 Carbohydrate ABC transporter membrane protein 2 (CUT1 family) [Hyphomicrobiales bact
MQELAFRPLLRQAALIVLGALILLWTLLPLYHMLILSLTPVGEGFAGKLWPDAPTLDNYRIVLTQDNYYLSRFWLQLGNSVLVAFTSCVIVFACSLTASFAITRLRPRFAGFASHLALVTYLVPATFLAIPFYQVMGSYGLLGSRWALIITIATFATPYAIWVLQQNAGSVPRELDEAAEIDGASPWQIFRLVYLPLMVPTIVAVGAFAVMLSWNEYLYAFLLLSDEDRITLPVMLGQFLSDDSAPWPLLMVSGVLYSLPPAILYFLARRYMAAGLAAGSVKG